ncbi:hypothetical protein LNK15_03285 [Jeotgalicoccus huakuii]|nr:hypothetical protein [Jeotgalicoccus huakuii]
MKLATTNSALTSVMEYLPKVQAKGRVNRARQKLMKKIAEKYQDFHGDLQSIKADTEDEQKQLEEFGELLKEEVVIDMGEHEGLMHTLYEYMLDYPYEIDTTPGDNNSPSNAVTHDHIVDVLEAAIESKQITEKDDE